MEGHLRGGKTAPQPTPLSKDAARSGSILRTASPSTRAAAARAMNPWPAPATASMSLARLLRRRRPPSLGLLGEGFETPRSFLRSAHPTKQEGVERNRLRRGSRTGRGGGDIREGLSVTQPAHVKSLTPAAGRLGRLGVAIVAAILAGPTVRSSGCARCGASTPELNSAPSVQRAPSVQATSPRQPQLKRLASREAQPKRLTGELKISSGGSYFVCVRACDGGFFPVPYVVDRDLLVKICQALCPNAETQLFSMPFGGTIEESVSMSGMSYGTLPKRRQIRAGRRSELLLPA